MSPIDLAPESHAAAALVLPELTVVVPTFNEMANIPILVDRLAVALLSIEWEVMFVDDNSPDGTAALAKRIGASNRRVRCIRRIGRRGLAGATIEGILASHAPYVAVMDADLQHDEGLLAEMLRQLRSGKYDLIIGSRYTDRGGAESLSRQRRAGSRAAALLVQRILGIQVSDPISGFFMLRRELFEALASRLSNEGFKILADILISARGPLRILEIPYRFRARVHGTSKLDSQVALDFVGLLFAKSTGSIVPIRFVSFALVGATGVAVHLATLKLFLNVEGFYFAAAQTIATFVAMTSNFFLNNALTYQDQRLSGVSFLKGLLLFYAICSVGAVSNVGVATWFFSNTPVWWMAGLFGSAVGAVWNYAVSSTVVWQRLSSRGNGRRARRLLE